MWLILNNLTKSLVAVTLVATALAIVSCESRPGAEPIVIVAKLDSLAAEANPPSPRPENRFHSGANVYIDGSVSMRGFTPRSSSDSPTVYTKFLTCFNSWVQLNFNRDSIVFIRFGENQAAMKGKGLSSAMYRDFYTDGSTRLVDVFNRIVNESNPPLVSIVITDGVPCAPEIVRGDWSALVIPVARWLSDPAHTFQILKVESRFSDIVYSITSGRELGRYSGMRPFYCFVFATNPDIARNLRSCLKDAHGIPVEFLNLSGDLFTSCRALLKMRGEITATGATRSYTNPLSFLDRGKARDAFWYFIWRGKETRPGVIRITLEPTLDPECREFTVRNVGLTREAWGIRMTDKFERVSAEGIRIKCESLPVPKRSVKSAQSRPDGDSLSVLEPLVLLLECPCPSEPGWYAYRIDIKTGQGTIQPPKWVSEVSTTSDAQLSDWSKTLYFKEFVQNLLSLPKHLKTVYIAIRR